MTCFPIIQVNIPCAHEVDQAADTTANILQMAEELQVSGPAQVHRVNR
jgi:hypothetical protein